MLPSNMFQNADEINITLVQDKMVVPYKCWHQPKSFPHQLTKSGEFCECPGNPNNLVNSLVLLWVSTNDGVS